MIQIYTDGACEPNPGPGAYGVHMIMPNGTVFELSGFEQDSTNNRMELMGPIMGLDKLMELDARGPVTVFSDSKYVIDGITKWVRAWRESGWKTKAKTPVKNRELWEHLDRAVDPVRYKIQWKWVRGHDGNEGNERADFLARERLFREISNDKDAVARAIRGFSRHHDFDPAPYLGGVGK